MLCLRSFFSFPFKQLDHKCPGYILVEYMGPHKTWNSLKYNMIKFNLGLTGKIFDNYVKIISLIKNSMVKLVFESISDIFRLVLMIQNNCAVIEIKIFTLSGLFWQLELHNCSLSFIQRSCKYSHFKTCWPWLIVETVELSTCISTA